MNLHVNQGDTLMGVSIFVVVRASIEESRVETLHFLRYGFN